jgi:hypothetical protein
MAKKWEYLVFEESEPDPGDVEQKLNKLGEEGWELVSVTATKMSSNYISSCVLFSLKREKTA